MSKTSLFENFEPTSEKQWKQRIQFELQGKDFNDTLVWKSLDGIDVKPFYHSNSFSKSEDIEYKSSKWKIGDAVCALLPGGGYAEYVTTEASHCLPIPAGMSLLKAAGLPENHFTVYSNLVVRAGLKSGETILIHGGSSGIGTTAIQLARSMGCRVFVTAGSEEKCAACVALGAEAAFNYRETDFVAEMKQRGRADVILDMVGGPYMQRNIKALADDGRLVQIAFLQGPKAELNMVEMMTRRLTLTGSTLRPQSILAKSRIATGLSADVWPKLENGQIDVVIDSEFALSDAAKAHERMETSAHIGKIMLKVSD